MIPYILTETSCTLLMNNKMRTIKKSAASIWERFIEALKTEDVEAIKRVLDTAAAVETFSQGNFKVVNDTVYHKNEPLHKALSDRVIRMIREGFNADPMLRFIDNLLENPSSTAINELYEFLEACDLPITPDGHFIAYKRIQDNYMDCHSGTIRNQVGDKPSMPRAKVNDDRRHTCSHGLHVCSIGYLAHFHGSRLIVCKINPRDVVSIPVDYQNSKMRVCQYEVIEELDMTTIEAFNENLAAVYDRDMDDDEEDFNDELDDVDNYED